MTRLRRLHEVEAGDILVCGKERIQILPTRSKSEEDATYHYRMLKAYPFYRESSVGPFFVEALHREGSAGRIIKTFLVYFVAIIPKNLLPLPQPNNPSPLECFPKNIFVRGSDDSQYAYKPLVEGPEFSMGRFTFYYVEPENLIVEVDK